MFASLAHLVFRFRIPILALYVLLLPVLIWRASTVFDVLRGGGFEVPGSESDDVFRTLEKEIHVGGADILALWTVESGTVDDIESQNAAFIALSEVEKDPAVVSTVSWYATQAPQLITKDRSRTFLLITLKGDDQDRADALKRLTPLLEAPPLKTLLGGIIPVNNAVQRIIAKDLARAEAFALPITGLLLMWIFGSVASAALPLILGLMTILLALAGVEFMTHFTPMSVFAVNIISLLGLGLAIDYSLFLVSRFREELKRTGDTQAALVASMTTTGRAVAFSGITVAASLIGLYFFPQMFLRSMANGGIMVVLGTVMLALTLLPALLAVLGPRVDAWRIPFAVETPEREEDGLWYRLAILVMKRPLLVTVAVLVPMIMLGLPFLRFDPSFPDYRILPQADPAYIANEILDREFEGDQLTPIDVLCKVEGSALAPDNLERLHKISQALEALRNTPGLSPPKLISGVFTLVPGVPTELIMRKLTTPPEVLEKQDPMVLRGINAFAGGSYMRFAVLLDHPYNRPESLAVIKTIRAMKFEGVTITVGGPGAYLLDMRQTLIERSPWMVGLVALVMFVVLFFVFGSVTLPLKAMFMNVLSISASFGAIVWVFQDGRFAELLHYTPLGISDCTAPLLMFSIVFGLSMDYEVLILARVREEYVKTGDNDIAVARGLARTGRLITSAAVLLVVVIGAFGTSQIIFMKSLGLGMSLAVLIDATIIRALLVPAAMKLMGKWNWWAPKALVKLWERAGLGEGH